jgi:hypothetical protein|eukprot:COSAG01_NODE_6740_length_3521_cov_11.615722_1_plen_188_part_00
MSLNDLILSVIVTTPDARLSCASTANAGNDAGGGAAAHCRANQVSGCRRLPETRERGSPLHVWCCGHGESREQGTNGMLLHVSIVLPPASPASIVVIIVRVSPTPATPRRSRLCSTPVLLLLPLRLPASHLLRNLRRHLAPLPQLLRARLLPAHDGRARRRAPPPGHLSKKATYRGAVGVKTSGIRW